MCEHATLYDNFKKSKYHERSLILLEFCSHDFLRIYLTTLPLSMRLMFLVLFVTTGNLFLIATGHLFVAMRLLFLGTGLH